MRVPVSHGPPPRLRRYDSSLELRSEAVHLRQQMGTAERILWTELRDRRFRDLKFGRQHALGPFVADFYCVEHRRVVEIDGSAHDDPDARLRDATRDEWMQARGIRVVRLPARLVLQDRGAALAMIERTLTPGPSPARGRGE